MSRGDEDSSADASISKNLERKIQRKQKRFQHIISTDSGIICCDEPTKVSFGGCHYVLTN